MAQCLQEALPKSATEACRPEPKSKLSKDEKYLPIVPETLHHLREYLLGSKPVTQTSLAKLLFNEETIYTADVNMHMHL